jgi:uncharacterized protein RhaS with RHS repeats
MARWAKPPSFNSTGITTANTYGYAGRVEMTADANGKWTKNEYDSASQRGASGIVNPDVPGSLVSIDPL